MFLCHRSCIHSDYTLPETIRLQAYFTVPVLSASLIALVCPNQTYAEASPSTGLSPHIHGQNSASYITVTARHWDESPSQTPISLTQKKTENSHEIWQDLKAISQQSPNVRIEQSSVQNRVILRGITAVNTGLQDPVGYFLDGVALPMGASQAPYLFNTEQIQLLKGPQGTLYGRNTEAGAIKITTQSPVWNLSQSDPDSEAVVKSNNSDHNPASWLNLSHIFVKAPEGQSSQHRNIIMLGSSGSLIDNQLAAGLAIRAEKGQEGFYNHLNNSHKGGEIERYTLSASADWWLSDNTEVRFRSTLEDNDSGMARMRFASGNGQTSERTTNYNTDAQQQKQSQVHSITVEHEWDKVTLTAITGLTHFGRDFVMDLDASPMPAPASVLDLSNRMISQEIRFSSEPHTSPTHYADSSDNYSRISDNTLRWLAGLYMFDENSDIQFISGVPSSLRDTRINQHGMALFANMDYLANKRLTLSAGARIEYLDQDGKQTFQRLKSKSSYQSSQQRGEFLPRLGLSYHLSPQSFLYASLARGYLPGGYNYNLAGDVDSFTYKSEYSDTAEAGIKTRLTSTTDIQLAAFYTQSTDKHILDLQPGGIQKISNAAEARIYGLEFSLQSALSDHWQLFSSLGLQRSEATDYTQTQFINGTLVSQDLSGNELPMAAPYNWQTGLSYNTRGLSDHIPGTQGIFGTISLQGSGDFWFDSQNQIKQEAYQTLDLEVGYQWPYIKTSIAARNLLDQHYYTRAVNTPNGLLVEDAAAREISFNLSARW